MSDFVWIILLFAIPLTVLWTAILIDLVRRSDISLGRKLLWGGFTALTAEFGAIVYISMHPLRYPEDELAMTAENELAEKLLNAAEQEDREALERSRRDAMAALS